MSFAITALKHFLAWTSDEKKLISGSLALIRIVDTAAWQQIAILQGIHLVTAISLPPNNRFLVSVSLNKPARLWNLDANLPVGPPLHHERSLYSAALSPDGKVLVTACRNKNAYAWDVHAILKEVGLEDLSIPDVPTRKPLMTARDMFLNLFSHLKVFPVLCGTRYPFSSGSIQASLLDHFASLFRHIHTLNSSNAQRGPSSLVLLSLSKFLQCGTNSRNLNRTARDHRSLIITTPHASATNPATPGARATHSRFGRL